MDFEKVMKFGGAALADGPSIERACSIVEEEGGERPVVVVSAHQGVTALLDAVARAAAGGEIDRDRVRIRHRSLLRQLGLDSELLDRYFAELASLLAGIARRGALLPGERDLVLSYGERMSARVVGHALKRRGVPATPVDAFDLGLTTDSNHGSARPLPESRAALREALREVPGVPVVTGFLAKDRLGNLTTLGRNGSDLTAALLAEAIGARELELWKAVGGMMTADPVIVPEARVLDRLSFEDAALLAGSGAEVLHPEALAPAVRAGIVVRFRDVRDPRAPGTVLEEGAGTSDAIAIATRRHVVRVRAREGPHVDPPGLAIEPVARCIREGCVDLYLASGPASEAFILEIGSRAEVESDLALLTVVARGAGARLAGERALEAVLAAGVRPVESLDGAAGTGGLLVVRDADLELAARSAHAALLPVERVRAS